MTLTRNALREEKQMNKKRSNKITNYIRIACLSGALMAYSASAFADTALPQNGEWVMGGSGFINSSSNPVSGNTLEITQNGQNAVIKWGSFDIDSMATVNFGADKKYDGGFNILNYVNGGNMSQIHGTMKADGGNVYLINPAGVLIGQSAKIEVGSLYVGNQKLNENNLGQFAGQDSINKMLADNQPANVAELMSLGQITANNVTFDGSRIVLDVDNIKFNTANNVVKVITDNEDNVVLGYKGFEQDSDSVLTGHYEDATDTVIAEVNGNDFTEKNGYMWVENVYQLQAINNKIADGHQSYNYALRNEIDASATEFEPIGGKNNPFEGKFDGLGFSIKGLRINKGTASHVGLFGHASGGSIKNVTLEGGTIQGADNVGGIVGRADNVLLDNLTNGANVKGNNYVGGVVGGLESTIHNANLVNNGTIQGITAVGGIIGMANAANSIIDGNFANYGTVQGRQSIGGIIGSNQGTISTTVDGRLLFTNKTEGTVIALPKVGAYGSHIGGIIGDNKGNIKNDSSIENLLFINNGKIENSDRNQTRIGGVIGGNSGNITNVTMTNRGSLNINGGFVGGVIGNNYGNGRITSSKLENYGPLELKSAINDKGNIAGVSTAGGVIGFNGNAQSKDGKAEIIDSILINYGTIAAQNDNNNVLGGVVGRNGEESTLKNNSFTNTVAIKAETSGRVGGIIGINDGTITVDDDMKFDRILKNTVAVNGMGEVGGIIATNQGSISGYAMENSGDITGTKEVGGVIGKNDYDGKYYGKIESTSIKNYGSVTGVLSLIDENKHKGVNIGGIIGQSKGDTKVNVIENTGVVTGLENVGGVIGEHTGTLTVVLDNGSLVNNGEVKGDTTKGTNIGGVIGNNSGKFTADSLVNSKNVTGLENVGGVIGNNSSALENVALTNNGSVTGTISSVGGVIGNNIGALTNVAMTNTKAVSAENASKVGGYIGSNTGKITSDDGDGKLANNVAVTGKADVGGLIGNNTGAIIGYTLENSGAVTGTGSNTGGLIGANTADITQTSAYNTGTVSGQYNVGGLIGSNSGKVSGGRDTGGNYYKYQVYNNGSVKGTGNNVGGLIGTNGTGGELIAAYNTGSVNGNNAVGGAVGSNGGKVDQVFNVGSISGSGSNSVAGAGNGTLSNSYSTGTVNGADNSYYTDDTEAQDKDTYWKKYGTNDPILKVFLTKAIYNENISDFTYNGKEQGIIVENKDNKVLVYRTDGTNKTQIGEIIVADEKAAHSLADYFNTYSADSKNNLINGTIATNAGTYDALTSVQINTSNANNPNNLGFDFEKPMTINQAELTITLDDIWRVYGNVNNIYKDANKNNAGNYSITVKGWVNDAEKEKLGGLLGIDKTQITDGALKDSDKTQNAGGDYTWSIVLDNITGKDSADLSNYKIVTNNLEAKSNVLKATLQINVNDTTITRGETPSFSGSVVQGLVNGDGELQPTYGLDKSKEYLIDELGSHENVIGVYLNGTFYDLSGATPPEFATNYDLVGTTGTLTVLNPELSDSEWKTEDMFAWDKKREERERKVEVYFVSGGMEL